jgi:hypothetical protein
MGFGGVYARQIMQGTLEERLGAIEGESRNAEVKLKNTYKKVS